MPHCEQANAIMAALGDLSPNHNTRKPGLPAKAKAKGAHASPKCRYDSIEAEHFNEQENRSRINYFASTIERSSYTAQVVAIAATTVPFLGRLHWARNFMWAISPTA
jgi:hypothetical protein